MTDIAASLTQIDDDASPEQAKETRALLRLLELGKQDIAAGRTKPARAVIDRLRNTTEQ